MKSNLLFRQSPYQSRITRLSDFYNSVLNDSAINIKTMQPYYYSLEAGCYPSFHTTSYNSFDLYIDQQRMAAELQQIDNAMRRTFSAEEHKILLNRIDELDDDCEALEECTDHFTLQYEELIDHVAEHFCWPHILQRERRLIDHVHDGMLQMQEDLQILRECLQDRMGGIDNEKTT
jgi:hypothetical protein